MALPQYKDRISPYLYNSMVFNGVALHEAACCTFILIAKFLMDKQVWKTPIFYMSCVALLAMIVAHYVDMRVTHPPPEEDTSPHWQTYYSYSKVYSVVVNLPQIFTHCVIILRLRGFCDAKSRSSITLMSLTVLHAMVYCANVYLGVNILSQPKFFEAPLFPYWAMSNGVCVLLDAIINISASALFVLHIATALNIPRHKLVSAMFLQHDGLRWLAVIGMNYAAPFGMFLVLYTFLEGSYVAAKKMIEQHSMANRDMVMTTHATINPKKSQDKLSNAVLR
ncbi:hypothetical protein EDD86DRAFT_245099 [Gorgonomyces haynaldii]|nr:hypothetical protein EDD86DRAFT_245099 [Gorgonomyces haynaldii]